MIQAIQQQQYLDDWSAHLIAINQGFQAIIWQALPLCAVHQKAD